MPAEGTGTEVGETNALTLLLGEANKVFYYHGEWKDALATNGIQTTNFDVQKGIGKVIREKQRALGVKRDDLTLMIKPLDHSSYKSFIDALDEVMINALKRYAFMEPSEEEKTYFMQKQ